MGEGLQRSEAVRHAISAVVQLGGLAVTPEPPAKAAGAKKGVVSQGDAKGRMAKPKTPVSPPERAWTGVTRLKGQWKAP